MEIVGEIARALPDTDILVAEPFVDSLPPALDSLSNLRLARTLDAVDAADIVVLLVEHDQFRALNRSVLAGKVVYDTRGIWR